MNIADVKVGHVGLEERERGMKGDTESKSVRKRKRERERGPLEADLSPALQCCVSLLLDKVIRHQKVLFLCFFFALRAGFEVINPKVTPKLLL